MRGGTPIALPAALFSTCSAEACIRAVFPGYGPPAAAGRRLAARLRHRPHVDPLLPAPPPQRLRLTIAAMPAAASSEATAEGSGTTIRFHDRP